MKFSQVWNEFIQSLRMEDLISNWSGLVIGCIDDFLSIICLWWSRKIHRRCYLIRCAASISTLIMFLDHYMTRNFFQGERFASCTIFIK